jgi:transposase
LERRKFSREFKREAIDLIKQQGVSLAQGGRDHGVHKGVHKNVLRNWVRDFAVDPVHAFPRLGRIKPEQLEIDRLRKEVTRLKAERISRKRPQSASQRE